MDTLIVLILTLLRLKKKKERKVVHVILNLCPPGSEIEFRTSNSAIKPLVTHNLTLTCRLPDTTPVAPVGPAVGRRRRSVTSPPSGHLGDAGESSSSYP